MNRSTRARRGALALSLAALLGACVSATPSPSAPPTSPPATAAAEPAASPSAGARAGLEADEPEGACLEDALAERLGLGLKEFADEDEMAARLGEDALFPDPATMPEGMAYSKGYFNASQSDGFTQSTIGLQYIAGDVVMDIFYFTTQVPQGEPREPHETILVRGRKAYLFAPPFQEGLHSVMWREACRYRSVIVNLPAEQVIAIAEGLAPRTPSTP